MSPTNTLTPAVETTPAPELCGPTETNAQRRHRMRDEATARHSAMLATTRALAKADKAAREAAGMSGREGFVEWSAELRAEIRAALDGHTVRLTLARVDASRAGTRCILTGVTEVKGHVVALRAEGTLRDWTTDPTGQSVDVRLTLGQSRTGAPVLTGESIGVATNGQRVGLRCRVTASRHVRVAASAL